MSLRAFICVRVCLRLHSFASTVRDRPHACAYVRAHARTYVYIYVYKLYVRGRREETFLEQLTGGVQKQLDVGLDVIFFELVVAARHARVVWSDEDAPCPGTELPGYLPSRRRI